MRRWREGPFKQARIAKEVAGEFLVAQEAGSGTRRRSAEPFGDGGAGAYGARGEEGRGGAGSAAGIWECWIGEAGYARRLGMAMVERFGRRCALRIEDVGEESGVHGRCRADA